MTDHLKREIDYMRISITDRCNLRCRYCMPEGVTWVSMAEILTLEECARIAALVAQLEAADIHGDEEAVAAFCEELKREKEPDGNGEGGG